jgi:hypothetical protein
MQQLKGKHTMKKYISFPIFCAAVLAAGRFGAIAAEEKSTAAHVPMSREDTILVSLTAGIEAIDYTNREVTLKGPLGNEATFTVDEKVKRFNEFKVGDQVRADYYVSVAAELRKPTAEEEKNPLMVLDAAGKAPPGTSPAAGGLRHIKVVATIEGLDRPSKTVTVKGPRGRYLTVRVADPSRLTQVRIGDPVVITYTEALAVSLEKAEKKTSE